MTVFASLRLLAQYEAESAGAGGILFLLIWLAIAVLVIAGVWKAFAKAGEPGWACLIPIFNLYVMLRIAGKPGWWLLLYLIPGVNLVVTIIVALSIAENFGKGAGFAIGLVFLAPIFWIILGFGSAVYRPVVRPAG